MTNRLLPRRARASVLVVALNLALPAVWAQDRGALQDAVKTAQAAVKARGADMKLENDRKKALCAESEAADEALAEAGAADPDKFIAATRRAREADANCKSAITASQAARGSFEAARDALRDAATLLAQCATGATDSCAMPAPAVAATAVTLAVLTDEERKAIQSLVDAASTAQQGVDDLRTRLAKVYDKGDAGTAAALGLDYSGLGPEAQKPEARQRAQGWAETARTAPGKARQAVSAAQDAADLLVRRALQLKACAADQGASCARAWIEEAQQARQALQAHGDIAKRQLEDLDMARYSLAELKARPNSPPDVLADAVHFRRLLDRNPDVKSFFGGDTVGLSAGASGTSATVRYTMDTPSPFGNSRFTFIASSPTVDGGLTTIYDTADKFEDKARLTVAFQTTRAGTRYETLNVIQDGAVGFTLARDERKYLVPGDQGPAQWAQKTRGYTDWGLGGRYVLMLNPATGTRMLQVGYDVNRTREDGQSIRQCQYALGNYPDKEVAGKTIDVVSLGPCVEGPVGPPAKVYDRMVTLGFKQKFKKFDLGLSVKHSLIDHLTDVELPVYFIGNLDDKDNGQPLSGGLVARWSSSPKIPGLRWGLFVSAPLDFKSPPAR